MEEQVSMQDQYSRTQLLLGMLAKEFSKLNKK